jgi:hypothetical protein
MVSLSEPRRRLPVDVHHITSAKRIGIGVAGMLARNLLPKALAAAEAPLTMPAMSTSRAGAADALAASSAEAIRAEELRSAPATGDVVLAGRR